MTNGLIQHITVEESTSIQRVNINPFICQRSLVAGTYAQSETLSFIINIKEQNIGHLGFFHALTFASC